MSRTWRSWLSSCTIGCTVVAWLTLAIGAADEPTVETEAAAQRFFAEKISPLIATHCLECHQGPASEADLDLSDRSGWLNGGEAGAVLVPGQPEKSLAWQRVHQDEMPPESPLSDDEKALLNQWIRQGAPWAGGAIDRFQHTSDTRAGYDWWSLQPLETVEPPRVSRAGEAWCRNEIDRFVWQRLAEHHLEPSAEADRRSLIRRLWFDLVGLPPPPDEVARFQADPSNAAYARMVQRLLDSPHYGERWGRHWLDVVRFGESDGFERNTPRDEAWPYRDWVIQALNDDLPYDQFVRLQLAGDLLEPSFEGAAAVGFMVAGIHNTVVGQSERMKRLARQDELEEVIGTIGQTFLGLTVNCARCHDHKFDPVSSRQYYQLIAAIDGVDHGQREIPVKDVADQLVEVTRELEQVRDQLRQLDELGRQRARDSEAPASQAVDEPDRPTPIAAWEFDDDTNDSIGSLHAELVGEAHLSQGGLQLDGNGSYAATVPLDRDLADRTLEAWVVLDDLQQQGGAVISLQTPDGATFDAIVFGEQEAGKWMAGSNGFTRTQSFQGPVETQASDEPVHVAITYQSDGTIRAYRNGQPYGEPYQTGFATYSAGKAQIIFGLRHSPAGGNRLLKGRVLRAQLYDSALSPAAIAASAGRESDYVSQARLLAALSEEQRTTHQQLTEQVDQLLRTRKKLDAKAKAKVYSAVSRTPPVMRVHPRGSVVELGEVVAPAGLPAVAGRTADWGLSPEAPDDKRRLALANWITHPDNAIFYRTIVNRVWHYHFGQGIVETPSDLGFNGGRPSHPQLLEWLTVQFRENGQSLKWLHRTIVMSATYRQASAARAEPRQIDANNRLLWRYAPHRLEAEVIRDAMLVAAGQLNDKPGGPGFRDVSVTYNDGTTYYEPIDPVGPEFNRRTVYRFTPRGGRSAVLDTFDCPDPSTATPRRSVTTTPLQALSLLNDPFVLRMSAAFAQRAQTEQPNDLPGQIDFIWKWALGRTPEADERAASQVLVQQHGLATLARGLFNTHEFVVIE